MLTYIIESGQSNPAIIFPSPTLQVFTVESHIHICQIVDNLSRKGTTYTQPSSHQQNQQQVGQ
jgi:hypothetical protein